MNDMNLTKQEIEEKYEPRGAFEAWEVLATDMGNDRPYLVRYKRGDEWNEYLTLTESLINSDSPPFPDSDYDLIPKEERVTGWVNVYKDGDETWVGNFAYCDEDLAQGKKSQYYFATIHIDVKRGE